MIFTQSMVHLTALVLKRDLEPCTKSLLELGLLDFVEISELSGGDDGRILPPGHSAEEARLSETRRRIENLISGIDDSKWEPPVLSINNLKEFSIEQTEQKIETITGKAQELREQQRRQQQEILRLEEMTRQLSLYGNVSAGIQNDSSFLSFITGTVAIETKDNLHSALSELPSAVLELGSLDKEAAFLVIVMKRDEKTALRYLENLGWQPQKLQQQGNVDMAKENAIGELQGKIGVLRKKQKDIENEYTKVMRNNLPWMQETWQLLRTKELYCSMQDHFSSTDRTILFSGWVPSNTKRLIDKALRGATNSTYSLFWQNAGEIKKQSKGNVAPPVQLTNPKIMKPFEMLVTNYAVPEYGTVDPTPFVAVAYLIMFGLMFGDAGHGLVLVILGTIFSRIISSAQQGMKNLAKLIQYCGLSAIVTGILFGSYFGLPLFKPLWFNFHALVSGHSSGNPLYTSIYDVLLITIYFGIAVIGCGLILNWINLLRKKDWRHLLFDKGGIVGGWMYGFGVYTGFYFATHSYKELPGNTILLAGFAVPALILLAKEPIAYFSLKHSSKDNSEHAHNENARLPGLIMTWVMEWIVELLEIFSGYLANTLSFMRVAGLGIAHVSLMIAFSQIAENTTGSLINPLGLLIYLLGNVLVIALEGLSAGIQSLRLNYYEFFSKYFTGAGKAYMPISLKSRIE